MLKKGSDNMDSIEKELPVLYMMVGLAGGGKSTYADKLSKLKEVN